MNDGQTSKWKKGLTVAGIFAIGGLGLYSWHLNNEIQALKHQQSDPIAMNQPFSQPFFSPWSKQNPNPQNVFDEMRKQMDKMMDSFSAQSPFSNQNSFQFSVGQPKIELKDEKDNYEVDIGIPKGAEVNLNTKLEDHEFTVEGSVTNDVKNEHQQFNSINQFARSFYLDDDVKESGMRTTQSDDKIIITLPKA